MNPTSHPWIRDGISITRALLDSVESHAIEAYGHGLALADSAGDGFEGEEACGVLSGPAASSSEPLAVDEATRWPNLANRYHRADSEGYPRTGRTYFLIDPLKFSRAIAAAETAGRPVKVLYHSHLDCGAYFSETDAATALAGGEEPAYELAFLVVSVRGDGRGGGASVDDRKLFLWDAAGKRFVEGALTIA